MTEAGSTFALGFVAEYLIQLAIGIVVVIRSKGSPQARMAWLLLVLLLPLIGLILFLAIGRIRLNQSRIDRFNDAQAEIRLLTSGEKSVVNTAELLSPGRRKIVHLAGAVSGTDLRTGNLCALFSETDHLFDVMIRDIDAAQSSCNFLFYIYLPDNTGTRVGEALKRAAARGVECRLLVDSLGAKPFLRSRLRKDMEKAGILIGEALPVAPWRAGFKRIDHRNHRKIAVIDGHIGWTGSQNVADAAFAPKRRYAPWIDLMMRIDGPAVHDLQALFIEDWLQDCNDTVEALLTPVPPGHDQGIPVQVLGTGPLCFNQALEALVQVGLSQAEHELILTTPYLVPDQTTFSSLQTSARSGVSTSLIVPARNDSPLVAAASRSFYEGLLEAGVEIYEYQPGLLHAKTISIDGHTSVVATANLDRRSFELNAEVSVIVFDQHFTQRLRAVQKVYIGDSQPVHLDTWRERGLHRQLLQIGAGVLAPLL